MQRISFAGKIRAMLVATLSFALSAANVAEEDSLSAQAWSVLATPVPSAAVLESGINGLKDAKLSIRCTENKSLIIELHHNEIQPFITEDKTLSFLSVVPQFGTGAGQAFFAHQLGMETLFRAVGLKSGGYWVTLFDDEESFMAAMKRYSSVDFLIFDQRNDPEDPTKGGHILGFSLKGSTAAINTISGSCP